MQNTFFKMGLCPDTKGGRKAAKTSSHIIHSMLFPMIFLENTDQKLYISALSNILIQVKNNV